MATSTQRNGHASGNGRSNGHAKTANGKLDWTQVRQKLDDSAAQLSGEKAMSADIVQGTWANNVEKLERGYKREDIKIHDNSGNIINMAEKDRLTGTMMNTPDQKVCLLKVDQIEK